MLKLLKHELKSTFKFMLSLSAAVLLASVMFNYTIKNSVVKAYHNPSSSPVLLDNLHMLPLSFAMVIVFGASISFFFYLAGRLKRNLYEDEAYLTFSLPVTGYQVMGVKSISAILWGTLQLLLVALSAFIFHRIFLWDVFAGTWKEFMNFWMSSQGLYYFAYLVFSTIMSVMLLYLSILLSKVLFRAERGRWIWFLLFMVVAFFNNELLKLLSHLVVGSTHADGLLWGMVPHLFYVIGQRSAWDLLLPLLMSGVLFAANGYLLDKRVEL